MYLVLLGIPSIFKCFNKVIFSAAYDGLRDEIRDRDGQTEAGSVRGTSYIGAGLGLGWVGLGVVELLITVCVQVRGARAAATSGVVHAPDPAALSHWLKSISDNIVGLTNLQVANVPHRPLSACPPHAGDLYLPKLLFR